MITIKTKEEIATLREGGKIHASILRELARMVMPGVTSFQLEEKARELVEEKGDKGAFLNYRPSGNKMPYPAVLCVSVNDEVVHGIPNDKEKILQEGDIVTLDLGPVHKGLITDAAVTVPVGNISKDLFDLLDVTKKALYAGIKVAKDGCTTGDIGEAISRFAISNNYGIVEELCGHGVGYSVHEDPYVPNYGEKGKGEVLKSGAVIAIEPIFNLGSPKVKLDLDGYTYRTADGKSSAHFEHTVVITKSGAEILTE